MARPHRPPSSDMTTRRPDPLVDDASGYAFFQALRLLRLRFDDDQALRDGIRVRPALSLAFPETDIDHIERDEAGRYRIEANFFGLYGVTSPLPTFYTEDLIDQAMLGNSAVRDFLDVIHAALYPLLFQAWEKYRIWLAVVERNDTHRLQQLAALVGLAGGDAQRTQDARDLLPFAGNLGYFPRSALGLEGLVGGLLGGVPVAVESCVLDTVIIPDVSRNVLGVQGTTLGEDALVGEQMADRAGSLAITIGPLSAKQFHELLPGAEPHRRLVRAIALYLDTPLRCELALQMAPQERQGASLGLGWQQLGYDTWTGTDDGNPCQTVRFPLPKAPLRATAAAAPLLHIPAGSFSS